VLCQVEDTGTTNGTYVNNERVTAMERTPLADGCLLSFGGPRQVVHQGGNSVRNPFMYRVLAYPPVRPSSSSSPPPLLPRLPLPLHIRRCIDLGLFTDVRVWASWGAQDAEPPSHEATAARLVTWAQEEEAAAAARPRLKRSAAAAAEAGSEDRAGSGSKHAREGGGGEAVVADVNATTQPYDAVEGGDGGGGGTNAARGAEHARAAGRMGASTSTASMTQRVTSAHTSGSSQATAGAPPSTLPRWETERATPAAMRLDAAVPDGPGCSGELRAAVSGVMEELRCAICYEPMVKAHVLTCSHSFCGPCIFQWLHKACVAASTLPLSRALSHSSASEAKSRSSSRWW
jgi:hypothetical protein